MTASTPVTPELPRVLRDITDERQRQIAKGWTPEHDDRHATSDMIMLAGYRLASAGLPDTNTRERIIEGLAILAAAVESFDRRTANVRA